jgi:hypothetical protein
MDSGIRAFSSMLHTRDAAYSAVANASGVALPLVGTIADQGMLSCFVEVPFRLARMAPDRVPRTVVRIGRYREIFLSLPDLIGGGERIGFLLASHPLSMAGDEYQADDAESIIGLVEGVMPAVGGGSIGPPRCMRCNCPIPAGRVRIVGPTALCVRCQSKQEKGHAVES